MSLIALIFSAQLASCELNQNEKLQPSNTNHGTQTKQVNTQQLKEKQVEKKRGSGELFSVSFRINF